MKKILFSTLLIIVVMSSCSNNESLQNESASDINYTALNKSVDDQISTFRKTIINSNSEDKYLKYFKTQPLGVNSKKIALKEKTIKITLAPHYNKEENEFMLSFYQDLANCYDNNIVQLINSKKSSLNNGSFSSDFKNEVNFIFSTIEKTANEVNDILNQSQTNSTGKSADFGSCFSKEGKNIGRAVATGAIVGAVGGALTGAAGGTIALPGVGSAAGAIGGAVFGAAKGAVGGGLTTLVWVFIDCAMERKGLEATYIYANDFYNDILFPNDPDQLNFNTFDDYDPITNSIILTPDDTKIRFIR